MLSQRVEAMDADGKLGLRDALTALLALPPERTQGYHRALEALQAIPAAHCNGGDDHGAASRHTFNAR